MFQKNLTNSFFNEPYSSDHISIRIKEVLNGKSFRDAYKDLAKVIENGKFKPNRKVEHKHIGSLGNLRIDKLKEKVKPFLT